MEPQDWFEGTFDSDYLAIYESTLDPMRSEREAWEIVRALELKAGAAVLDCPCGYGRHALVLARAGFHVAGVDLSPAFLEIARERALKDDLKAEFHQADMRALPSEFEARFDGAFSAFTSFGFFDKDEENAKALAELARCVRPGSRVLVEMRNHLQLLEDLRTRTWFRGRGCLVLEQVSYDWLTDQIVNRREVYFDDGRKRVMPAFRIRAYKPHDMIRIAENAGLKLIEIAGGLDGQPFKPFESLRMVLLTEK